MYNNIDFNLDSYEYNDLLNLFDINEYDEKIINDNLNKKIQIIDNYSEDISMYKKYYNFYFNAYKKLLFIFNNFNNSNNSNNYNNSNNSNNSNITETYNIPYKRGIINPLKITNYKKILSINSVFRDKNFIEPTDFDFILSETLKNVVSIKLINYNLPLSVYTVSSKYGSNNFNIKYKSKDVSIIIDSGSYSIFNIVDVINNKLIENDLSNIKISYNQINGKISFTNNNHDNFIIDFKYNEVLNQTHNNYLSNNKYINKEFKNLSTLGWILGYRNLNNNLYYSGNNIYISESIYDIEIKKNFSLYINDFNNNSTSTFIFSKNNSYQFINEKNILAKLNSNNLLVDYPKRKYFGPVDINKLNVKVFDDFGRLIDTNNSNISIDIECEILYDY